MQNWRKDAIRQGINAWYVTKQKLQQVELEGSDLIEAHQLMQQINELHIQLKKILYKTKDTERVSAS